MSIDFKTGVVWAGMHVSMWSARVVAEQCNRDLFHARPLVVTEALAPRTSGLHPDGRAMDLRTKDLSVGDQRRFAEALASRLGPDYDVVLEGPAAWHDKYRDRVAHIHVEYDPPRAF
jgi:hypothetical protein